MIKQNNCNKIAWVLMGISILTISFVGCKTKTPQNQPSTGQNQVSKKFDPQVMKAQYESALKDLVADGTITQSQADKVLAAVTSNISKPGTEQNQSTQQNQGNQPNQGTQPNQSTQPAPGIQPNTSNNPQGNTGGKSRGNRQLAELVTSGVITQDQADKITEKLREKMKNQQSSPNQ